MKLKGDHVEICMWDPENEVEVKTVRSVKSLITNPNHLKVTDLGLVLLNYERQKLGLSDYELNSKTGTYDEVPKKVKDHVGWKAPKDIDGYYVNLEATRPSVKDPVRSITYTKGRIKKAFPGLTLIHHKLYKVTYLNGPTLVFKYNSNRLYSGALTKDQANGLTFVDPDDLGYQVFHRIVKIELYEET